MDPLFALLFVNAGPAPRSVEIAVAPAALREAGAALAAGGLGAAETLGLAARLESEGTVTIQHHGYPVTYADPGRSR